MSDLTYIEKLVWDELIQAKSWEQYISEYTGHKIDWRKWVNIFSISLSVIGASTWGIWKAINIEWITPLLFILTGISQLVTAIQKDVIIDNKTITSLSDLRSMYIGYYNKLERLFLHVLEKDLSQQEIKNQFFDLRETIYSIEELKDSLNIDKIKKVTRKVKEEMKIYLNGRWDINIE